MIEYVTSPEELRKLPKEELPALAEEIREKIIDTVSKNGGHLASNLGTVELTLALHYAFDTPRDTLVFDVGHQCYAHKLITGRGDRFDTLRQAGGLSGFSNRQESEYDTVTAGHSGSSVSAALGIAYSKKLRGDGSYTVAVAGGGDSALQEALMLSEICRTVYLIHRRREFRGDVEKQRRLAARENVRFLTPMNVTALHEKDGDLTSLTLTDAETGEKRELAVEALFVSVGQVPALEAFADALPLTGDGYAALGEDCTSPVPGIFAAGDCRSKEVRQLTTAVADGACAALAACRFLEVT